MDSAERDQYASPMNKRIMHTVGLVLVVLGCASLVRSVMAGQTGRVVVLAIPAAFAVVGFVLLVVGGALHRTKSTDR